MYICPWSVIHSSAFPGLHDSEITSASHLQSHTSRANSSTWSLEHNDVTFFWIRMNVILPPSSLLRSVFSLTMLLPLVSLHSFLILVLAAEFLSSFAAPYISSFCYCLPFLLCHCCPLPSFFDLKFSVSSLFLMHLGTSPLMNRGSFLPPPFPFIHTLRVVFWMLFFFRFPHAWRKVTIDMSKSLSSFTFYLEIFVVSDFHAPFLLLYSQSSLLFCGWSPHPDCSQSLLQVFFWQLLVRAFFDFLSDDMMFVVFESSVLTCSDHYLSCHVSIMRVSCQVKTISDECHVMRVPCHASAMSCECLVMCVPCHVSDTSCECNVARIPCHVSATSCECHVVCAP